VRLSSRLQQQVLSRSQFRKLSYRR
jgi:hypothetical protein